MKSLKLVSVIALFAVLLIGCAGWQLTTEENHDIVVYSVETLAVPIGYYAAQNEFLDTSLRQVYNLATEGKLTPEGVNKILAALDTSDALQILLIKRGIRLLELVGAQVAGDRVVSLSGLDPELISAAARGYLDGFDTYQLSHQKESDQA